MKKRNKRSAATVCISALFVGKAQAVTPVFDLLNFASNVAQNVQLTMINKTLTRETEGSINYYARNITDNSVRIQDNTKNIDKSTKNIDKSTKEINRITNLNFEIDADFTWIINKGSDVIIPIPEALDKSLSAIHGSDVSKYKDNFKDATAYAGQLGADDHTPREIFEGSRARKAANDMLVESVELERAGMKDEADALNDARTASLKAKGHGHQLQVANALAISQINQTMKLRNSLLVTEAQRAAEAQVAADKDARAIAVAKKMRRGLGKAVSTSRPLTAAP
ncbi:hypothetical protein L2Y96_00875 [Luteibacter aegosomaticola]|uniref:hypothetical protein n=1 Tax=Luteibacter aegosomaticola TaxID=2911538 RepID=UPI001FFAF454|nr:hypothetical protein [Luteibacter aegosomaticola]UPG90356.1 hypothetical protein L2Y96_00875 [Luteibacter aegosomaticola]